MPKVSIITAAYNHVDFVRQSVESALNQTYRDFEHIVVDDGTTDGTAEVLQSYGNQIKYIRQENRGAHAAINAGIRASSGEYIAILDSDDAWLPQKLERQMPVFDKCPRAGLVYSQAYVMDATGRIGNPGVLLGEAVDRERPFEDLLTNNRIPVLTAIIKRRCFDEVGGFSEDLPALADWELWIRIAARWPLVFVPEILALYRDHGRNTSHTLTKNGHLIRDRLKLLKETAANLPDGPETERRRDKIGSMYAFTALQQSYALSYRGQNLKAMRYFLFALKLRPSFIKDVPAALRSDPQLMNNGKPLRLIANLIFGMRED